MIVGLYVWHKVKQLFVVFDCFTSQCLTIQYFSFVYLIFMSLIVLHLLHNTSVLSFYIDVVMTLFNKSPRSLTVYSASWSNIGCVSHQGILPIDSRPYHSMTIGPLIPQIQIDLENSRSKVRVKVNPVSAASSWLISLVFHIRASYRIPSLSVLDNRASHSRDTIWPWQFKVKGQRQRYPSQRSIQLRHFLFVSHQLDQLFLWYGK